MRLSVSAGPAAPAPPAGAAATGPDLIAPPTVSGSAAQGAELLADPGTWSGSGQIGFALRWMRDGRPIPGATGPRHVVGPADAGTHVACLVTATDDTGARSAVSAGVTIPAALAPAAPALLLMVAGQSNARTAGVSAATPPDAYTDGTLGDTWILVQGTGIADAAFAPYDVTANADPDNSGTAWGSEAAFVHRMREAGDDRPVYIVKEATNGHSLDFHWDPARTGADFARLEDKVARARTLAPGGLAEVLLWCQGEQDANDEATAAAYAANLTAWFAALRARVTTGLVVVERIRPLGYAPGNVVDDSAGYLRAAGIREAQVAVPLADGTATSVDLDFLPATFPFIHPGAAWTEGKGARGHAAWTGTYDATYGAITDTAPAPYTFADQTDVPVGAVAVSDAVEITGLGRRAPVEITGGEWRSLNALDGDSVVTDWTAGPGHIDTFRKLQLRATASATADTAITVAVSVGGVGESWSVRTAATAQSYRAETEAFTAAAVAQGGQSIVGAQKDALDAFYDSAAAASWWPKVARLYCRLADETSSLLNLVDQTRMADNGGSSAFNTPMTWSAATGWTAADGSRSGISLDFDPSVGFTHDDHGIAVFFATLSDTAAASIDDGGVDEYYLRVLSSGSARLRCASGGNVNIAGVSPAAGMWAMMRTDAATIALHGPDGTIRDVASNAISGPTASYLALGSVEAQVSDAGHLGAAVFYRALTGAEAQDFAATVAALHAAFAL
ncbi:hypothetical protein ROJ8625_02734 [Roseivivax jejudonensis]|uniref:Sialate O-acetylesterase domain-containing protein n=1 Tax=Roseivivax jejudonensis TaxID=1529041 RepID=A0A1X6ZJK2_9RHOB|nr:sialate O-acetylesterase [Roseivivax jejudonensis]SLN53424.1 hypothetical protein ROJ8625_02734 [Roseivivax jejudonensis]